MILNAHMSIEGEYTVQVFRKDGTLSRTIGPHKNFITSTGLSFIGKHAIADCFRFISLGMSSEPNTIQNAINNGWGTINLSEPKSPYTYIGGRTAQQDGGYTTTQYSSANFKEYPSGLSLSRGWRIPAGNDFFLEDTTFREVMLSPGRPYITGLNGDLPLTNPDTNPTSISSSELGASLYDQNMNWTNDEFKGKYVYIRDPVLDNIRDAAIRKINSNTANTLTFDTLNGTFNLGPEHQTPTMHFLYTVYDTHKLCSCSDAVRNENYTYVYGKDCAALADHYAKLNRSICESTGAFVRIVKDISVLKDESINFNYSLFVNIETGIHNFIIPINNVRPTQTTNWSKYPLSGSHNLLHHGVKYITTQPDVSYKSAFGDMVQVQGYDPASDFGESFVGSWGSPLEPSTQTLNLKAYLTSDNLQFYTDAINGGAYVGGNVGFLGNLSGLMAFRQSPYKTIVTEGFMNTKLYNIRRNDLGYTMSSPYWPISTDYTLETTVPSEALNGFEVVNLDQSAPAAISLVSYKYPSVRSRQVTRTFQFNGSLEQARAGFNGKPIRGIVLSYVAEASEDYHLPYLDCLFTDSGAARYYDPNNINPVSKDNYWPVPGSVQAPQIVPIGNEITTSFNSNSYSEWYYMDGQPSNVAPGLLTFSFIETWSSPCHPDVDGC